jgi:hypothetical protein
MKYFLIFLLLSCSAPDYKRQVVSEFSVPTDNLVSLSKIFEVRLSKRKTNLTRYLCFLVRKSDGSSVIVPQNKIDILYDIEPNAILKNED